MAPLSAAASGTATVSHAASSPSYAARRRAASGCVASPRANAIGTRSIVPSGPAISTTSCDDTSPCSRCQASTPDGPSSAASDSSASPIWNVRVGGGLLERELVRRRRVAPCRELVDAERRQPRAEPLAQRPERGRAGLQLDGERGGTLVPAVGRDETVEVRVDRAELLVHRVRRGEDLVERGDVGVGRLAGFDVADAELVVERAEAIDVGEDALERGGERRDRRARERSSRDPSAARGRWWS